MADNDITPRPGRIRDTGRTPQPGLKQQIFRQAGSTGLAASWSKGHIKPGAMKRGMGTGMRAAAGLIAPGGRRVIVKARYTTISGRDLGAARAHLKYIQRDGVMARPASSMTPPAATPTRAPFSTARKPIRTNSGGSVRP